MFGPEGGELEDTEPWVVPRGGDPASRAFEGPQGGGPTVTEGNSSPVGGAQDGGAVPVRKQARPVVPGPWRRQRRGAFVVGAALMEGPMPPPCVAPRLTAVPFWAGLPLPVGSPWHRPLVRVGSTGATGGRGALARWRSARGPGWG